MTEIWLIRHAQASFGAADYDRLSELGHRQSRWLGEFLRERGVRPARVVMGAQRRHRETAEGILEGLGLSDAPAPESHRGFNEYDAGAILAEWLDGRERPAKEDRAAHFRALSGALAAWQAGEIAGAERWADFEARVAEALAFAGAGEGPVLAITSGGAIGQTVRAALEAPPAAMIRAHMQVKNAGFSRLHAARGGPRLTTFNETPHLDPRPGAVTWS